jgi:16S rRNA pseudouridine516 synthase
LTSQYQSFLNSYTHSIIYLLRLTKEFGRRIIKNQRFCADLLWNSPVTVFQEGFAMRLDRYLANAGAGSRRDVRRLIQDGHVRVAGQLTRDAACQVAEGAAAAVEVDGQPIVRHKHVYLMLNKPAGLLTALEDRRYPTIAGLIPPRLLAAGVFPVGRLDRDATGLLILTSDGTLGHRLASPRWAVWKTYAVTAEGTAFSDADPPAFAGGVRLADGQVCRPARLEIIAPNQALLSIHEGKYHQVKKMMLATSRRVTALHRIRVGTLLLDEKIAPGECRELTEQEIGDLYRLVELPVPD